MAYSLSAARQAIIAYIDTQWADALAVRWPNRIFTEPSSTAWVSVDVLFGPREPGSVGSVGIDHQSGLVAISVFQPLDAGVDTAMGHQDTFIAMLNKKKVGTHVRFELAEVLAIIPGVDEKWNQHPIQFPFRYYDS